MKIEKRVTIWFKEMFSGLNDGGLWGYPDGGSLWRKMDDRTIAFASGKKTNPNNIRCAAYVRAAGFNLIGI